MSLEESSILKEILRELKIISMELNLLRTGLRSCSISKISGNTLLNPASAPVSVSSEQVSQVPAEDNGLTIAPAPVSVSSEQVSQVPAEDNGLTIAPAPVSVSSEQVSQVPAEDNGLTIAPAPVSVSSEQVSQVPAEDNGLTIAPAPVSVSSEQVSQVPAEDNGLTIAPAPVSVSSEQVSQVPAEDNGLTIAPAPVSVSSAGGIKDTLAVQNWLNAKEILVKKYHNSSASDDVFDKLAFTLGSKFENLSILYDSIKRSFAKGSFTLKLSSNSQLEIKEITNFCSILSSYAFLEKYEYNKYTKTIYAIPQRVGPVVNFFTGGWFERYILQKVLSLLSQNPMEYTYLLNPHVTFNNGDNFEFDLFFLINNQPLWVECKTSDYQSYIAKYSETRRVLSIPKERAILVILGIPSDLTQSLTDLYDMTIANEKNFFEKIRVALGLASDEQGHEVMSSVSSSIIAPVSSGALIDVSPLLNKVGLRPMPEYRGQFIKELIRIVRSQNKPITAIDMKSVLAERIPAISKSQLQDLFNVIVRSGCMLNDSGLAIFSFNVPISKLVSEDPLIIESKCIECYIRAVLVSDSDYFEHSQNIGDFERIIGGKAPDITAIRTLTPQTYGYAG